MFRDLAMSHTPDAGTAERLKMTLGGAARLPPIN